MKIAKIFFLFSAVFAQNNLSFAGNGVERGQIPIQSHSAIPKGLEDRIENMIFSSCDLLGATKINTTYFYVNNGSGELGGEENDYQIHYTIDYGGNREVHLFVQASLIMSTELGSSTIIIKKFNSPACKGL